MGCQRVNGKWCALTRAVLSVSVLVTKGHVCNKIKSRPIAISATLSTRTADCRDVGIYYSGRVKKLRHVPSISPMSKVRHRMQWNTTGLMSVLVAPPHCEVRVQVLHVPVPKPNALELPLHCPGLSHQRHIREEHV